MSQAPIDAAVAADVEGDNSVLVIPQPPGSQSRVTGTQENPVTVEEEPQQQQQHKEKSAKSSQKSGAASRQPTQASQTQQHATPAASGDAAKADGGDDETDADAEGESNADGGEVDSFRATERFKTWRKHTRDLYQVMFHLETHWPSSACQLLPYMTTHAENPDLTTQTVVCGTKTADTEQNYLQLMTLTLPRNTRSLDDAEYDADFGEVGGYECGPKAAGFKVESRYFHDGDVLTARYMHCNPRIIATASSNGNVYVFDPSNVSRLVPPNKEPRPMVPLFPGEDDPEMPTAHRAKIVKKRVEFSEALKKQQTWDRMRGNSQHELLLSGNAGVGYTIDWNVSRDATLICGSQGRVCLWRVGSLAKEDGKLINATSIFATPAGAEAPEVSVINDCRFSFWAPATLYAVTEGGLFLSADTRATSTELTTVIDYGSMLNSVSPSPHDANIVACGDGNGTVAVFDLRNASAPFYSQQLHKPRTYISQLQWCPHSGKLLLSGGEDGFCCIFDTSSGAAGDGGGGLKFRHAGHTEVIYDASWSWQDDHRGLVVTADPNAIIAWRPRNKFWH